MKKILRRTDTKENRDYWAFVDRTAAEVEAMCIRHPWMRPWVQHFFCGQFCQHGNGSQTWREVAEQHR